MDDHVLIVRDVETGDVLVVGPYAGMAAALDDLPAVQNEHPGTTIHAAPQVAPRASLLV